jgi:hypothetical protein
LTTATIHDILIKHSQRDNAMEHKLIEALENILKHLWDDRKRDVKKNFSLMVAEAQARTVLLKARENYNG